MLKLLKQHVSLLEPVSRGLFMVLWPHFCTAPVSSSAFRCEFADARGSVSWH